MSTLVLTSLNPNASMDYQLRCFDEWAKVGYLVHSYNSEEECVELGKNELNTDQLKRISVADTAQNLFGKPIPRILPILEGALQTDYDHFILTNSDIFPAHRKVISDFLAKSFESVAFTRTECFSPTLNRFNSRVYYRGGLDLFWFSKSGLHQIVKRLRESMVADRMTFGVPGWDFYLGHVLCRELGCPITDGTVFLHRSHKISYGDIDEFGYYSQEMNRTGIYSSEDSTSLAEEFSNFIEQQCLENERISRLLKLTFYKRPKPFSILDDNTARTQNGNQEILEQYAQYLSSINVPCAFTEEELEVFTTRQRGDKEWATAISLLRHPDKRYSDWTRKLQLLLISMLCTRHEKLKTLTFTYPVGNKHSAALKQKITNHTDQDQQFSIFEMFASEMIDYAMVNENQIEMIDHGILNKNLMKYIFTVLSQPDDKALFTIIVSICKQGLKHA